MSTSVRFSIADNMTDVPSNKFFGHEEHVCDLERLSRESLLGHAYLFFGDEGVGKFRVALGFANFLERGEWQVPEQEMLSDVLLIACGEEQESVGIDRVRAIRKFLSATPFHSSRRTVIIRDAEFLTWEAESALLKIMEEPPSRTLIIMIARDPSALFPPLVSRMAKVYFARLSRTALAEALVREFEIPTREAAVLAARSFGRLGYALSLLRGGARRRKSATTEKAPTKTKIRAEEALASKLEGLILDRWGKGVQKESSSLAFLLSRLEAASRFNLNPRLQEKAILYTLNG